MREWLGRPVFRLSGVVDRSISTALAETILVAAGTGGLVVDLDDATVTNRDALARLIAPFAQHAAGRVAVSCGRLHARRLLRTLRHGGVVVAPTVNEAARTVPPGSSSSVA